MALVILGVVFFAFEGSLTLVLRSLAGSEREAIAGRIAENRRELIFSTPCAPASGTDSLDGVTVEWAASPAGRTVRLTQTSRYRVKAGEHTEHYDALGVCQ